MTLIDVRQLQYLNEILTQDHRAMTCVTRRVMEFKFVEAALHTLAEIEVVPIIKQMIKKGGSRTSGIVSGTMVRE